MHLFKKTCYLLGLTTLALSLASCAGVSSKVSPDNKPLIADRPTDKAFRTELKKELSNVNISIEATARDIGDNLNRIVPRELYKGSTKTRGLTADILKNGQILVTAADNYIYLDIPISMSLSYSMFETPAIATRLKFRLNAKVTPDWKIQADIQYAGLSDILADKVGIGPISIKPLSIVEGAIQPVQRMLSDMASRKLNERFLLKSRAAQIWTAAQKPIQLDKNYSAWLRVTPSEMVLYPLSARDNKVKLSVGLISFAELVVGPEPSALPPIPLPNLKLMNGADKSFRMALHTDLYFKDLLAAATPLLLNKEFGSDGKSVVIKGIDIYGNGEQLVIKVETSGSLDGIIYLNCKPVFNQQTNQFSVEDVDFDMQSRSLLVQSAAWLLHGTIRSNIQEKLNMNLSQQLEQARDKANKALERVKLAENVFLTGSVKSMKLNDVLVQKEKLSIQLYTEGETTVILH